MGFALALPLEATTYSSAASLGLNIGLIPFSPVAVYKAQILIIPGIIAFTRKIAAEKREKMKPQLSLGSMAVGTMEEMDRRTFSAWSMLGAEGLWISKCFKI
jgi:hypothetical protein